MQACVHVVTKDAAKREGMGQMQPLRFLPRENQEDSEKMEKGWTFPFWDSMSFNAREPLQIIVSTIKIINHPMNLQRRNRP